MPITQKIRPEKPSTSCSLKPVGECAIAQLARREHVRDLATEASQGTTKLETEVLVRFPILVPKLDVSRKIVAVISGYDAYFCTGRFKIIADHTERTH